ncbi:PD-(D/E)XK motif protein [uncultured Ruminococcus sp.]|uniref:PD-(D/E)XK motif protein n=1 Tax=uncultured Ruminococcus sp. TaxID=165186 RepID=UPI00292F7151|nr:PD-(D/E)XK motif protein [uncultured Ruminococcus sp.]
MITLNDLKKKWDSTTPYSNGFLQISEEHPLSVHVGYEGDQRCFVILDTGRWESIESSKAVGAECIEYSKGKYGLKFLLKYPSLDELFIKLCWDLLDFSKSESNPVQAVLDRYRSWLLLLQKQRTGLLSFSRQKGLIAELMFFIDQCEYREVDEVLSAWVGPEGCDQDFVFDNCWYEIKATAKASDSVRISSLQQLDRAEYGELIVLFMDKVSSDGTGAFSLPDVVEDVLLILPNQALKDKLECKLAMYGYYYRDSQNYRDIYYDLSERRDYRVEDGFPILSVHNVPHEIIDAKYSIELASIDCFKK